MSTASTAGGARSVLPVRQVRWTRLGARMGYTNARAKRAVIRAAVERMRWLEPAQLRDVLDAPLVRLYVIGLLSGRGEALHRAAVTPLHVLPPRFPDPTRPMRLIGLHAITGQRYVLLESGYEAIDLLHVHTTRESGRL